MKTLKVVRLHHDKSLVPLMFYPAVSVPTHEEGDQQYIKWKVEFGENYDEKKRAVEITQAGFYFIYLRLDLRCPGNNENAFLKFFVELQKWNEGYNKTVPLVEATDGVTCTKADISRTVFVGELFDLLKGDHVSVRVNKGYGLITKSSFGAYLT